MAKRILYQQRSQVPPASGSGNFKETVSYDRFQPQITPLQSNWQKAALYSVAAIAPFLFFVNTVGNPKFPERIHPETFPPIVQPVQTVEKSTAPLNTSYTYPSLSWNPNTPVTASVVTVDKWHPLVQTPYFDAKRTQYAYPKEFFVNIASLTVPVYAMQSYVIAYPYSVQYQAWARPILDFGVLKPLSDYDIFPDKIFDLARNQYTYPSFMPVDSKQLTQKERVSVDRWQGYAPSKIYDVARNQYTYPSSFQTILDLKVLEPLSDFDVIPDKIFDLKRNQYTYPSSMPIDVKQLTRPEQVTVDRWQPSLGQPMPAARSLAYGYPLDRFTSVQPILGASMNNLVTLAAPYPIRKDARYTYPSLFWNPNTPVTASVVTVDKWHPLVQTPTRPAPNLSYAYPKEFFVDVGPLIVPVYSAQVSVISYPHMTQYQAWARPILDFAVLESLSDYDVFPDKIFDLARNQYSYPSSMPMDVKQLTQKERVSVDRWTGHQPSKIYDLARNQHLYPSLFWNPKTPVAAGTITVDKWHPLVQTPPLASPNLSYAYPKEFFVNIASLTVPVYAMQSYVIAYPFSIQYQALAHPLVVVKEVISADKWQGNRPDRIFDLARKQYTYPSLMPIDPKALTQKERVSIDRWHPNIETPPRSSKHVEYTFPSLAFHSAPISPIPVMSKWYPGVVQPYLVIAPKAYTYQNFTIDAIELEKGFLIPPPTNGVTADVRMTPTNGVTVDVRMSPTNGQSAGAPTPPTNGMTSNLEVLAGSTADRFGSPSSGFVTDGS